MRPVVLLLALGACGRTGFDDHDAAVDGPPDARAPRSPLVWTAQTSNTANRFYDVWGTSATNIYAVGDGGTIDHWDGGVWTPETTPDLTSLYGVNGSSPTDIRAVGNATGGGGMAIWKPNGTGAWVHEPNPYTVVLNSPLVLSATNMYVAAYAGTVLHSTGDGTWTPENTGTTLDLEAMWASGPTDIYAVGYGGTILHSTGDGTWTTQTTGTFSPLISIGGESAASVWAVGHAGRVLHSTGDGVWMSEDVGVGFDLYGVFAIDDFVIVSGVGNAVVTKDGDGPWTQQQMPVAAGVFDQAWAASPDDVWLIGGAGTILHGTRQGSVPP